ncbi:winged helix-turn-helix domain-containing protein [Bdellovibrionota bacterium FG-1]
MRHTKTSQATKKIRNWLQLAQLRYEKCELAEAQVAFRLALQSAKKLGDLRLVMEALSGLLRLAADALDEESARAYDQELEQLMAAHLKHVPPMAWYCKGVVARRAGQLLLAQRYVHHYLCVVRAHPADQPPEAEAKGWVMLATLLWQRGRYLRARGLAEGVLRRFGDQNLRGINGLAAMVVGNVCEKQRDFEGALEWYQKAHGSFLGEHHWYYHLYALYGYARVYRQQKDYAQAYWYLDLLDKAVSGPGFGMMKKEILTERGRLEQDAVDLMIDSRQALIKTREAGSVSLGKQHVLLHILEVLSKAHDRAGDDSERGLSKAEIIEKVWKESYRPEAHDNKLYYNINRLRKLLEPDVRKPQYLLNWKEGYRLAPGLKVQFVGGGSHGAKQKQS